MRSLWAQAMEQGTTARSARRMILIVVIGEKAELAGDFVDDLLLALAGIGVQVGVVGAVVGVTGSGLGLRLAGRLKLFYRLDLVDGESAAVGLDRAG